MKYYSLQLMAESPLAIRSDHAPGGADTTRYITGTTLTGSLAAAYRLLHDKDTGGFESLFLRDKVFFPNLYPALFKDPSMHALDFPVYPLPKTAQACKRFGGFQYMTNNEIKKGDDKRHGVRDSLFDWALFNTSRKLERDIESTLKILDRHKYCTYAMPEKQGASTHCNETMEPFGGYYCRDNDDPKAIFLAEVDPHLRVQTHTGIDRESGTVQESILYNRQVFDDGMRFWGEVKVDDEADKGIVSRFEQFIGEVGGRGRLVRLGTGRTRGLGKVSLAVQAETQTDRLRAFKEKLEAFNAALQRAAGENIRNELKPFYFALTLHSPAILYDRLLCYRGCIDTETLEELAGLPKEAFELVYQAASIHRITGWNDLWGTPKTNEYAIDTGSVFLFTYAGQLNSVLQDALFQLEEQGIGQRRVEGFGRVCVSDPFHREVELI